MLTLYHSGSSVCSQKARLAFAEKEIDFHSVNLDMSKGEHQTPAYRKLNPNAVVPTLVTETGQVIRESSLIIEYVDGLKQPLLMPSDTEAHWQTKLWLIRCIEIHAAVNSFSFASVIRDMILSIMEGDRLEAWLQSAPAPDIVEKRRDLLLYGGDSVYVTGAIAVFDGVFRDMSAALEQGLWLSGSAYGLADCALLAYVDRLRRLGFDGLYKGRFEHIEQWLERSMARPSYEKAVQAYYSAQDEASYLASGAKTWPLIAKRLS